MKKSIKRNLRGLQQKANNFQITLVHYILYLFLFQIT